MHILKKYGELVQKAEEQELEDEHRLNYFEFALRRVYKDFESGEYNPSAAEIWGSYDRPSPCGSCGDSNDCGDTATASDGFDPNTGAA